MAVLGDSQIVQGRLVRSGYVRDLTDAQRVRNKALSEYADQQSHAPLMFPTGGIPADEQKIYENLGLEKLPILQYNTTNPESGENIPPPHKSHRENSYQRRN